MTDACKLERLTTAMIEALSDNNLPLAQDLVEQRLRLLQSLCETGAFSPDLVSIAKSVAALDKEWTFRLEAEKNEIQHRLVDIIAAGKATQSYKNYSK